MALIVKLMAETLPLVGAASEPGLALGEAIRKLVKFVPPGAVGPAGQNNAMQAMQLRQQQAAPQMAAMRAQSAQPPAGGAPTPPPGQ